jgi:Iron dependent repressor, N-terminal DNA binding domain.
VAKRSVFVNVGFDPTAALDIVSALQLTSGEQLILVYPAVTEEGASIRAEQARNAIRSQVTLLRAAGRKIRLDELALELRSLESSLERLIDRLFAAKNDGYSIVLELSGGVRIITVLMVMVSMWFPRLVDEISLIVEVTRQRVIVPTISPLLLSPNSSLKVLACTSTSSEGIRRKDIARTLHMSEGSVSRAVSRLKRMGLVNEKLRVLTIHEKYSVLTPLFKRVFAELSQH